LPWGAIRSAINHPPFGFLFFVSNPETFQGHGRPWTFGNLLKVLTQLRLEPTDRNGRLLSVFWSG